MLVCGQTHCFTPLKFLRPFGARPPARRDSSFLPALTADIQKFVKAGTLRYPIASIHFSISVKSPPPPKKCELFRNLTKDEIDADYVFHTPSDLLDVL